MKAGFTNVYRPAKELNGRRVYASPATPLPPSKFGILTNNSIQFSYNDLTFALSGCTVFQAPHGAMMVMQTTIVVCLTHKSNVRSSYCWDLQTMTFFFACSKTISVESSALLPLWRHTPVAHQH